MTTAHMTVYPPATIAKMITTLDQIGPGRVGLNLVTGASYLDLEPHRLVERRTLATAIATDWEMSGFP